MGTKLNEMSTFQSTFRKQYTVTRYDSHPVTPDSREPTDQGLAVVLFEFLESTTINYAGDNFSYVILPPSIRWNDPVDLFRIIKRRLRIKYFQTWVFRINEVLCDVTGYS